MLPQSRTSQLMAGPAALLALATFALAGCGASGGPASTTSAPASASSASSASASASTTTAATTSGRPAQAPPAGYQWVGIPANQAWLAVPDSWVVLNPNAMSIGQALKRAKLNGLAKAAMRTALDAIKKNHGIMVVDTASVATSPEKFVTNVNMFCAQSPIEPGPGAANAIATSIRTAYAKAGSDVLAIRDVTSTASLVILRVEVDLLTPAGKTAHDLQYVEVTSQGQLCYTTFSTDRPGTFFPLFEKIARTIRIG